MNVAVTVVEAGSSRCGRTQATGPRVGRRRLGGRRDHSGAAAQAGERRLGVGRLVNRVEVKVYIKLCGGWNASAGSRLTPVEKSVTGGELTNPID